MNWIQAEGTLEDLRKILNVPGVEHLGRGVRPLADGRFRAEAYVQETAGSSTADQLAKLADLKEKGALTEEEFAAQKAKILA